MLYLISLAYCNSSSVSHVSVPPQSASAQFTGKNDGKCKLYLETNNFLEPSPHIKSVIFTIAVCVFHV